MNGKKLHHTADIDSDEKFDEKRLHRLCTETWIEKDLRTKYCSTSKMCVREFDHYCGWLGVPIGRDNNRRFVMLCLWEFFTQLAHFALIWYCIVSEAMKDNPENGVWGTIVFVYFHFLQLVRRSMNTRRFVVLSLVIVKIFPGIDRVVTPKFLPPDRMKRRAGCTGDLQ